MAKTTLFSFFISPHPTGPHRSNKQSQTSLTANTLSFWFDRVSFRTFRMMWKSLKGESTSLASTQRLCVSEIQLCNNINRHYFSFNISKMIWQSLKGESTLPVSTLSSLTHGWRPRSSQVSALRQRCICRRTTHSRGDTSTASIPLRDSN